LTCPCISWGGMEKWRGLKKWKKWTKKPYLLHNTHPLHHLSPKALFLPTTVCTCPLPSTPLPHACLYYCVRSC
jgi:hypothetical protein